MNLYTCIDLTTIMCVCWLTGNVVLCKQPEPGCYSRWDYEYKSMEKLLKLESQSDELNEAAGQLKDDIVRMGQKFENLHNKVIPRSTYTRWGRTVCSRTASLVYKGYTAGKKHNEGGSGSDTICLPEQPRWRKFQDGNDKCCRGYIYGSEIDIHEPSNIFTYSVNQQNMPCAVCLTQHTSTLMIPAQTKCPPGWTKEFDGYLMSAYHSHPAPHNHKCVDIEPEFVPNGNSNDNEHILYLVEAQCGSLPCPPYVHGRELACVVCSI